MKTVRSKTCDACDSKGSCESASHSEGIVIQLENTLNASTGDRVVVAFKTTPLLKITFLLYIFPIILLIIGAATGDALADRLGTDPSITSLVAAFLGFSISFFVIRFMNNAWAQKEEFQPYLMRFAEKSGKCVSVGAG